MILVDIVAVNSVISFHPCKLCTPRKQRGKSPYIVPLGGTSYLGAFGYITAFQEMIQQVGRSWCLMWWPWSQDVWQSIAWKDDTIAIITRCVKTHSDHSVLYVPTNTFSQDETRAVVTSWYFKVQFHVEDLLMLQFPPIIIRYNTGHIILQYCSHWSQFPLPAECSWGLWWYCGINWQWRNSIRPCNC